MKTYYVKKINEIMDTLVTTEFDLFDGDKEDACEFIEGLLTSFADYVNIVVREGIMIPIWKFRFDGDDLRDKIQTIDRQRRNAHEAAISSLNALNRLCGMLGIDPFADVDTSDRYAVADMAGDFVLDLYRAGQGKGMDDACNVTKEYDRKLPGEIIRGSMPGNEEGV